MRTSALFLSFLALASAAPLIAKRDIVYHVVTDIIVTTVEITTTIWVPAAPSPAAHEPAVLVQPVAHDDASHTTSSQSNPSPNPSPPSPPVSSPTLAAKPILPAPPPPPPPPPPSPPAPVKQASPVNPPPPPPPPSSSPAPSPSGNSAGSSHDYTRTTLIGASVSDDCTPGTPCVGDITYYDPSIGVGACGSGPGANAAGIYPTTMPVVAVAVKMMGSLSSGQTINPLCFRHVRIRNPGNSKEIVAMVVDKCFGCKGEQDLDLSPAAYDQLADESKGRVSGIEWYWE